MSLTFYRAPMSTASITERVLAELGVPHETVTLDLQKGDAKKPEFTKLNPNAKVPVVVHDGAVVFESAAITLYLGETFGVDEGLWPAPGPKRAEAMKWVVWANVSFGETIGRWMRNTKDWAPADERNAKAGARAQKEMEENLRILDEALDGRAFLGGSEFTLVDAHVSSFLTWLRYGGFDVAPWKRVDAWAKRCAARPAFQRSAAAEKGAA
jgi:glutathione S-transferase